MSLINKMLQDLDARGSQSGSGLAGEIRPVMVAERRLPVMQIVLGATVLVIAMAIAAYFWLKGRAPAVSNAPAVLTAAAPASPPAPAAVAPVAAPEPVPAAAPNLVGVPVTAKQIPYVPKQEAATAAGPATAAVAPPAAPAAAPLASALPVAPATAVPPAPARSAVAKQAQEPAPEATRAPEVQRTITAATPVAPAAGGREMTPVQRAESQYRQAMAAVDEGRVSSAIDGLEQALKLNSRHDAARQSLVSLLIEAGRGDEAMRLLEQGLAIDAGQPALAMLLARMQIERGMSGVGTLQRTLPAAQGNAEYQAFLAGALQRENRHKEAVDQYQAALRRNPEQGVWLMGLGISLQADKRDAEALAAFQKAKMSGVLTPALMSFVQGRIQQLQ